jgi:hypothetical protein
MEAKPGKGECIMAPYFVSPTGKDSNPGTESKPWRTVHKAATTAVAGDTVIYEDGTYDLGSGQSAWNNGAPGNYITHRARNRHQAIWQQTSYTANAVKTLSVNYVKFVGLKMQQETITGLGRFLHIENCSYIELDGCDIGNCSAHVVGIWGGNDNILVNDCDIHAEDTTASYGRDGIHIRNANNTNVTIRNSRIYHNPHVGVGNSNTATNNDGLTVTGCEIYGNMSHGVSFDFVTNTEISHNTIRGAGNYGGVTQDKAGVRITEGANLDCVFNTICDCNGSGINVESNCGTVNICNNTLDNNNSTGDDYGSLGILHRPGSQGTISIKNNIIYHTQDGRRSLYVESSAEPALASDYNLWYDSSGYERMRRGTTYNDYASYAAVYEPHSMLGRDPEFVNRSGHNYELEPGSPAIEAGTNIGLAYEGAAPDIGAHPHKKPEPEPTRLLLSLSVADDQGNSLGQFEFEVALPK